MWRKSLKSSAIYSTKSKIDNLKVNVTLKTISSLLKLEKFNLKTSYKREFQEGTRSNRSSLQDINERKSSDDNDNIDENNDDKNVQSLYHNEIGKDDSIEVIDLEWQQKVFSRYEIEYYKDIQNCITDLQKEYHEWIIRDDLESQIRANNGKHNKIFTYVDSDNYIPAESNNSFPQRATEKETTLRAQKYNHPYTKSKVMYIYADLNPDTLLFMLRWLETEQMLIVYPDFNEFDHNPYFIEIDSDYRHLYSYAVQNISVTFNTSVSPTTLLLPSSATPITKELLIQENESERQYQSTSIGRPIDRLLPKSSSIQLELQNQISSLYDMPPKKYIRVNFLFNIKEAHDFEYNSLHVRYYIKLPCENSVKTTKLDKETGKLLEIPDIKIETGDLNGTTHSSNYKWGESINENNEKISSTQLIKIWNFSYPFQISLLLREKLFQSHENSLRIHFELISIDSWTRERTEGFCFILIPIEPGLKNYNLRCYRPDYGFKDRIERFFIGGRKIFNFDSFNNTESFEGFLNRFHTKCISTGKLYFDSECIFQRNPDEINLYGESEIKKKTNSGMTLDDIVKAYQEARKRLEATTLINDSKDETDI